MAFVSFLGLINGFYLSEGLTILVGRFIPTIVLILFLCRYIEDEASLDRFLWLLLGLVLFDAAVTILQGVGNSWGMAISRLFRTNESIEKQIDLMNEVDGAVIGNTIASGCFDSVVANGYFLCSFGFLFLLPLCKGKNILRVLLSVVSFAAIAVGLFYNQQRSAFFFFLIVSFAVLIFKLLKEKRIASLFAVGFGLVALILLLPKVTSIPLDELGRLGDLQDDFRSTTRSAFWKEFFFDNLLLGNREKFIQIYGMTPHSLFIETFLLGGIIGMFLIAAFLICFFRDFLYALKDHRSIRFLSGVIVVMILLNSWEHSSGVHTGFTLFAYPYAIYLKARTMR